MFDSFKKVNWKQLIISILFAEGIGLLAGFFTRNSSDVYQTLIKPPFSPPGYIFPIVWTVLYALMGISAYIIYTSDSEKKDEALTVYLLQLLLNFSWSIFFFSLNQYLLAFFVLLLLWVMILIMIGKFSEISPIAAYLQIPYLLWVTFAGYLNLAIYFLNP